LKAGEHRRRENVRRGFKPHAAVLRRMPLQDLSRPRAPWSSWWRPARPLFIQQHDSSRSLTQFAQFGAQRGPLTDDLGDHVISGRQESAREAVDRAPQGGLIHGSSGLAIGHPLAIDPFDR
jgi:hypothetical protein